jgi:hypothetical protein
MLNIVISKQDLWDEEKERFIPIKPTILCLEHNLLSMSDWESKHKKPLLGKNSLTIDELRDYVRCMTQNDIEDKNVYLALTTKHLNAVQRYMADPMTATTFAERKNQKRNSQFITNELIYCWMSNFNIPYQPCERWHLNRLLTLIKVCSEENSGPQKVDKGQAMRDQRALNELRKAKLGTKG